jgi:hypothetical protein
MSSSSDKFNFPNVNIFNAEESVNSSPETAAVITPPSMTNNQELTTSSNSQTNTNFSELSDNDLLLLWNQMNNNAEREMILKELQRRKIEPLSKSIEQSADTSAESSNTSADTSTKSSKSTESINTSAESTKSTNTSAESTKSTNTSAESTKSTNTSAESTKSTNTSAESTNTSAESTNTSAESTESANNSIVSTNSNQENNTEINSSNIISSFEGVTNPELLEIWNTTSDFGERDRIIKELQRRELFPSAILSQWEYQTGAYPDVRDPEFLQKLLAKREFAESLQTTWKPRTDPCEDDSSFEVTPVQRFVANFMSPKTPYMSALLFHGVGVGKTCAAVQIIEAWLETYPRNEVFLVAPPTIQQGFFRTIFDIKKVVLGQGNEPNTASQCTGITYMKLTNTLYERDLTKIEKAVNKAIKRRYKVFGYISFANFIRDTLKGIPTEASAEVKAQQKKDKIRSKFSGKLLVVDEAHNLRDIIEEDDKVTGGKSEESDAAGGKILTPYLRDVLMYSEGMKFCALTATPMYNTYKEIIFMLNLLLINDKQATITEADIFDKEGSITENGTKMLSYIAQRYVSFMRGENPISFPVRLFPQNAPRLESYPETNPRGTIIPDNEKKFYEHLPIVPITLSGDTLKASLAFMNALPPGGKGLSTIVLEKLIHAGNFIVPPTDETSGDDIDAFRLRTDINGLSTIFNKESSGGEIRYRAKKEGGAKWLGLGELQKYSPKFEFLINRIRTAEGCIFAYTRFVNGGALPLALALEANGYSPYGRKSGLLANGPQTPGGKQCALCPKREKEHGNANHTFTPAYYGLLTGDTALSPRNEQTIRAQRDFDNAEGTKIKIMIGSQIASEGVDLRFVRETHVIDSWFHLNKTEQILGRAIRFLSHCALPKEKRNNTVYLYTAQLPSSEASTGGRETADLYSYRIGFKKAVLVGRVTRTLKIAAIDCNLNNQAIVIKGQPQVTEIDAQGKVREDVDINDMPFTAVCDWIETCEYDCKPKIDIKKLTIDNSTYDEFAARWRVNKMKERLRALFAEQVYYQAEDLWEMFADIPRLAIVDLLTEIIDNKNFQVLHGELSGYIRYCNGYYIFQPNVYLDLSIPLAIRAAKFPIKRDVYAPLEYEMPETENEEIERENTTESVEQLWISISEWCQRLSTSTKYITPPNELEQRIIQVSHDDMELIEKYRQILEMVEWFFISFQKSPAKNPESFKKTMLNFFWDEWLTLEEQIFLVYSTGLNVLDLIKENQYSLGRILVNRFIDPKNGEIQFMCEGGKICLKSVADDIKRDSSEILRSFTITNKTSGNPYGFLVPKNGDFVFKTAEPPYESGKVARGKECGNVSTMTGHIANLVQIGDILKAAGKTDFDLNRGIILGTRKIKNSTRACTLMNIIIRYLDAEKIQNKRWFFRPVQAFYTGHKGTFRPGKK